MNTKELNNIITSIDNDIMLYSRDFQQLHSQLYNDLNIDIKLSNERTTASFTTDMLSKWLYKSKYKIHIIVNELSIKTDLINQTEIDDLNEEVNNESEITSWKKRMYVDSYLLVENLYYSGDNHLFVEYKMSNKFDFTKLAQDYLKFKFYTKYNSENSIFVYVLFDKNDTYPTILSNKTDKFCLIPKVIDRSLIVKNQPLFDGLDRIYIHVNNNETYDDIQKNKDEDSKIYEIYGLLDKINELSDNDVENEDLIVEIVNLENDIFYKNMNVFNNNVLIAKRIVRNYNNVKKLFEDAKRRNLFNDVVSIFYTDGQEIVDQEFSFSLESQVQLINDAKEYFYNFQRKYFKNEKIDALKRGLSSNYKSALVILVILKIFAILNDLELNLTLEKVFIDNQRNEIIYYSQIVEELANNILQHYNECEYISNISKLAFEIMYIITNLFPKIFSIKDDKIIDYNDSYKNIKKAKKIQEAINNLSKILNIREQILFTNPNFRQSTLKIFESIIDYEI